jgi:hypothetical protein
MPNTPLPTPPRSDRSRIAPSDEERDQAAALLASRFADDVLSLEQFEERVAEVFRVGSRAELEALTADLAPAPVAMPAPALRSRHSPRGLDGVPPHDRRFAILANLAHHSMSVAPRVLDVSAVFGNVELDLRNAKFFSGTTEIRVRAVCGHIAITLPAGTQLEQRASSILASVECAPTPLAWPRQGAPHVRLTGRAILSAVEIFYGEPADPLGSGAAGIVPRVDRPRRRP